MKKGSFLLEAIVYLAVILFLSSVLFKAVIYSYKNYKELVGSLHENTNLLKAIDSLSTDIQLADAKNINWKISEAKIIFKQKDLYISWELEKNNLYRAEWSSDKEKKRNLVATNIKKIRFIVKSNKTEVKSVVIELESYKKFSFEIHLINGTYEAQ
ncbi:hypothetical protein A3F66_01965 [candidate division TM6 bacterium RIFCSPHIGHO2_12_FULL_32_22]|nr:MAG: hypothetical protein A3F66_01965 [candidate division TM6 bacterium RIFCSPHIGHO2_12_FULL_32_22]